MISGTIPDWAATALRVAGDALAHAAGSIERGGSLCTVAIVERDGGLEIVRYEADRVDESVEIAHVDLRDRLREGGSAGLVYDGFVTVQTGERTDALMVEVFGPAAELLGKVIQPYRPARRFGLPVVGRPFAIVGPPIISDDIQVPDAERIFLQGARDHELAGRLFGA